MKLAEIEPDTVYQLKYLGHYVTDDPLVIEKRTSGGYWDQRQVRRLRVRPVELHEDGTLTIDDSRERWITGTDVRSRYSTLDNYVATRRAAEEAEERRERERTEGWQRAQVVHEKLAEHVGARLSGGPWSRSWSIELTIDAAEELVKRLES
jgi:hypothetical protein